MNYKIRNANPEDIDAIIKLCIEHALYEQVIYSPDDKAEKLAEMLFNHYPQLHCLLAESENAIIGYATFSKECSTWNADFYIHMDCLYLKEQYRGHGIGETLLNKITEFGKQIHAHHIEWQTPVFNERAIKFYNRIGASSKEKLRFTLQI